jgi:hypothetical protein
MSITCSICHLNHERDGTGHKKWSQQPPPNERYKEPHAKHKVTEGLTCVSIQMELVKPQCQYDPIGVCFILICRRAELNFKQRTDYETTQS